MNFAVRSPGRYGQLAGPRPSEIEALASVFWTCVSFGLEKTGQFPSLRRPGQRNGSNAVSRILSTTRNVIVAAAMR
jgi:hypothetical protein